MTTCSAGSQRVASIALAPASSTISSSSPPASRWATWRRSLFSLIATLWIVPNAEAAVATPILHFYHPDHLGSSNVITDGTGQAVEVDAYTPYGGLSSHTGPADVPQKFTGQRLDTSTGLYFYNTRYYDPSLGRFTSPDPFVQDPSDPQTLNRYSYVGNNPVNYVDPSGYNFWHEFFAILIGISFAVATGDPYYGYAAYQATKREMDESSGTGEAIVRTYAVMAAMTYAYGPVDIDPERDRRTKREDAIRAANDTHQFLDAAYGTHAEEAAQAVAQNLGVSAGRAREEITKALVSPLGTNITNSALRGAADRLSQLPTRPLGISTGAGLAGTGELGDEAAGVLSRSPVNDLKGAGNALSIALTVNEVHQTFQDPNLTLQQQNERAGTQVGALVGKLTAGALIGGGIGLAAEALGAAGGPLTFGIIVVGSGLASAKIDAVKTERLRRRGLLH